MVRALPRASSRGGSESTHRAQYSECFGNRSFYQDGWKLVALHQRGAPYDDSEWELYDIASDPTEVRDLAADRPDKVRELAARWESAALDNQVFPLDDGTGLLQLLRRPDDEAFHREVRLLPGTPALERYRSQQLIAFRDFTIDVELHHGLDDEGVLVAHGDQGGGYVIYVEQRELHFAYNHYGDMFVLDGGHLAPGARTVGLRAVAGERFTWDFELAVDGVAVASMPGAHMLLGFAPFQGIDVGVDRRSPVAWSVYERHGSFPYSGRLDAVTYRPGRAAPYDPQHLVEAIRAAGRAAQ